MKFGFQKFIFSANVESCGSCEFDSDLLENVPALWAASAAGHFTIVQTLVFEGANVNSRTKKSRFWWEI